MLYVILYILVGVIFSVWVVKNTKYKEYGIFGAIWPVIILTLLFWWLFVDIPVWISRKLR